MELVLTTRSQYGEEVHAADLDVKVSATRLIEATDVPVGLLTSNMHKIN